jgi:hypothetical protein
MDTATPELNSIPLPTRGEARKVDADYMYSHGTNYNQDGKFKFIP